MQYRLGMVLSGGGTRGLAHVGALAALAENGLRPDAISATSAGAIVGALLAGGHPPEAILEFFETRSPFRLSNISLAKPGFIDTDKVGSDLEEYLPDATFEELDTRLFITGTDIVEGRLEIFASGPVVPAVLASSAVPLVFTPKEIQGHSYVDGGVIDNFPVEPLLGLCDTIVGVYAGPLRRVERGDLKTSLAISQRAFEIGMYHSSRLKFHECNLVICPEELGEHGTFDTSRLREVYEIGHDATLARLDEIRAAMRVDHPG